MDEEIQRSLGVVVSAGEQLARKEPFNLLKAYLLASQGLNGGEGELRGDLRIAINPGASVQSHSF